MKTLLVTTILALSGIASAQAPPFVSDWEGAPDAKKIYNHDKSEYTQQREIKVNEPAVIILKPKKKNKQKRKKIAVATKPVLSKEK